MLGSAAIATQLMYNCVQKNVAHNVFVLMIYNFIYKKSKFRERERVLERERMGIMRRREMRVGFCRELDREWGYTLLHIDP